MLFYNVVVPICCPTTNILGKIVYKTKYMSKACIRNQSTSDMYPSNTLFICFINTPPFYCLSEIFVLAQHWHILSLLNIWDFSQATLKSIGLFCSLYHLPVWSLVKVTLWSIILRVKNLFKSLTVSLNNRNDNNACLHDTNLIRKLFLWKVF